MPHLPPDCVSTEEKVRRFPTLAQAFLFALAIAALAAAVGLLGIRSEPLWLDEIFSFNFAGGTLLDTLHAAAGDTHPPLYFLLLNLWRRLVGDSPLALRLPSVLAMVACAFALTLTAAKVSRRWSTRIAVALFAVLSPIGLFYAQETRMYALAAALSAWALLALLTLLERALQQPVKLAVPATALVALDMAIVLTHTLGTLVVASHIVALALRGLRIRSRALLGAAAAVAVSSLTAFALWFAYVVSLRGHFVEPGRVSWIPAPYLPNAVLDPFRFLLFGIRTPRPLSHTAATALAAAALVLVVARLVATLVRRRPAGPPAFEGGEATAFVTAVLTTVVPLAAALVLSVTVTPVYFGVRFVMFVFPSVALALGIAIGGLPTRAVRWVVLLMIAAVLVTGVRAEARTVSRTGLAEFAALWKRCGPPDAVLFFPRWNRRVAGYYLGAPVMNVPTRTELEAALRQRDGVRVWEVVRKGYSPDGPSGEWAYHEWLRTLGEVRPLGTVDDVEVTEIVARRLEPSYPELPPDGCIEIGRGDPAGIFWSGWYGPEGSFRWSRGTRAEIVFSATPSAFGSLTLDASCLGEQHMQVTLNDRALGECRCTGWSVHRRTFVLPSGAVHRTNRLVFFLPDARSPASLGKGNDQRILALALHRVCFERTADSGPAGRTSPGEAR